VRAVRLLVAATVAVTSSGCSLMFHSNPEPEQTYYLRAAEVPPGTDPVPVHASLRVMHPAADPGLDSPRIVLLQSQHRMGYYADSHWPAALPDLVESLAVETLHGTGAWVSIEDSGSPFPSDYLLQITIRRFEADYTSGSLELPSVHVVLECIVGRGDGREVIASYVAEGTAKPSANRLADVVAAFQSASSTALKTLSDRALAAVRTDSRRAS
jgi:cholesterol transport system auxiliary component